MNPQDIERIDRMRKSLYSRKHPPVVSDDRTPISQTEYTAPDDWVREERGEAPKKSSGSFFRKVLILSLVFFILSSGLALFVFFGGFNIISSNNVEIEVAAPVSVAGGAEVPLEISVRNKNNSDLEYANLMVEYPSGTRSVTDINTELTRERVQLGTIPAGKSSKALMKAIFFGEEHSTKDIKIVVEYKVKNSNGSFFKEKMYPLTLTSAPVSVEVSTLKEVSAGQEFTTTLTITSNSNTKLSNLLLTTEYPFGFEYASAKPAPAYDNSVWTIESLEPGEKKTIELKGRIEGQDGEDRTIRVTVGTQSPDDEKIIKTPFVTNLQTIAIKKPFIGLRLSFNREGTKDFVAEDANAISGELEWVNNLPTEIIDGEIEVKINGVILDRTSVSAQGGFFRSFDNTLVWDKRSNNALGTIGPGEKGTVGFTFAPRRDVQALRNPQMTVEVSVKGKRVSESQVPETIDASIKRTIKVATQLGVSAATLYSNGPFVNSGPIPPKVDTPTTYTIRWRLSNTANNVTGAVVRATLPQYVSWVGAATSSEKVVYDAQRNEVMWQPGQVVAGTGVTGSYREAYFQVRLLPSINQRGTVVGLTSKTEVEARDIFTNTTVRAEAESATTELPEDSTYSGKSGQVTN